MAKYLVHSPALASRRIGEEEVIVSPRAGKVWSLNPAGALVWELADGSQETEKIAAMLSRCRKLSVPAAVEELERFTESLVEIGLLEWREAPGAESKRSRRAAQHPPAELSDAPELIHEEQLQVLAGACDSSHSGQGAACMLFGSCASGFS